MKKEEFFFLTGTNFMALISERGIENDNDMWVTQTSYLK